MDALERERKAWIIFGCVSTLGFILFATIFFVSLTRRTRSLEKEIAESEEIFREHRLSPQEDPLRARIKLLKQRNQKLIEGYEKFESKLRSGLSIEEEKVWQVARPVFFKKRLYEVRKELTARARAKGIKIPASLAFSDEVPSEKEVPILLRQLEMVKELVGVAIASRIDSILSINCRPPVARAGEGGTPSFLKEFPIELEMTTHLKTLCKFLYKIQEKDNFFSPERIEVESISPDRTGKIRVSMVLSSFEFIEEDLSSKEAGTIAKERVWVKPKGY